MHTLVRKTQKIQLLFITALALVLTLNFLHPQEIAAQACPTTTTPATTYGQVTQSVSVTTAGSYRVWSRIKAPDTTSNSYYLQVDGGCAYVVGDYAIPANTWTWVNYEGGHTDWAIDITLTAGSHQLKYTGKEANLQLDRVLLLSDKACVPTGTGGNCADVDATPPTTSLTAPASGASINIGTTVNITANATDDKGVTKVEFYNGSTKLGEDTSSPYSYSWNTTGQTAGTKSLTSKAYDAAGNVKTSSAVSITLKATTTTTGNGDANNDGRVNGIDYSILAEHDGQNYPAADFNNDGKVGAADLAILLAKWTW